jgi:hypothetical protein
MTVGYGDMYANTEEGRVVSIIASIGGLFLTATLIGVVNGKLELSMEEKHVVTYMQNDIDYKELRRSAANAVIYIWKLKR